MHYFRNVTERFTLSQMVVLRLRTVDARRLAQRNNVVTMTTT